MRKKTKNRHGGLGLQVLLLMLALLIGGSPQARAEQQSFDFTKTDAGGGNYRCHGYSDYILVAGDYSYAYFETKDKFNIDNGQFYWGFHVKVNQDYYSGRHWGRNLNNQSISTFLYEGEIYLVTSDGTKHLVEKWKKDYLQESTTPLETVDHTWGKVWVSNIESNNVQVYYAPSTKAFEDGVKRIAMKQTVTWKYGGTDVNAYNAGWIEYEKDITLSGLETEKPMPKLSVDWGDGGMLTFKAAGVPDKRSNDSYSAQGYNMNLYYHYDNDNKSSRNNTFTTADGNKISFTNETNGKMDMAYSYWPLTPSTDKAKGAYTVPVFVEYRGLVKPKPQNEGKIVPSDHTLSQPWADGFFVKPFTRPKSVSVEFDKWNKKNVVTWTRQDEATGYNGNKEQSVACRYDGKWYVIRYAKGGSATDYTLVETLNGDASSLKLTDDGIDYNKEYTYRVIFLPSVLENKYRENLAQLPGYGNGSTPTAYDLWNEASISNKLEIPITLSHDKSETDKIHLTWEYNIPLSGLKWSVESRAAGSSNSWTEEQQLSLDPNKHTAEVRLAGSACDPKEYRVSVVVNNTQFRSDILGASLPSSTYISDVQVTTGTEEQKVVVAWKVENPDREHDIYYRVLRRIVGESDWVMLSSSKHGTFSEYEYTDDRAQAGTYYEYAVQAFGALCDEQLKQSDMIIKPGFSQARGTITGHIAYGSGTAVAGVRVNLVKSSTDDANSQPQFLSRRIDGEGAGLQWRANSEKYDNVLNGQQPLTLQLWARPQSTLAGGASQQQIVQIAGALELGVKESGGRFHLYAVDRSQGGKTVKEFTNLVFDDTDFTHVAATYSGGTWTFYVGTETLQKATMTAAATTWNAVSSTTATLPTLSLGGPEATRTQGSGFKGFVDDVRLWQRALTEAEITENYARILGGTESGMVLYWPFDEGLAVQRYAFDIARQDGLYQLNHPEVGVNVVPDASCPQHLKLYGMTDSEGNYIIKGVPFQQGGTNYRIVPELGVHEFAPVTRTMFVSPTSLIANNIDFEDVSSFPMEGRITYAGTNIPVEGIQFYVDGQLQTNDGEVQQTDANGRYLISVPIGQHYVEAKLGEHTMVGKGRFPLKGKHEFNAPVVCDFQDSTLVNFVGRVGGGERNDTLAVGFGASKNNIGTARITLKLNNESLLFNYYNDQVGTEERPFQSDTTAIQSTAWAGKGSDAKYIYIDTDPKTGEFSALLPPLKYITKSIVLKNNRDNIEFTTLPQIDLSNVLKEMTDSLLQVNEQGDSVWHNYTYNTKMVKTHYAEPQMDISQPGSPAGVFGMKDYQGEDALGKFTVSDLWTDDNGAVSYKYGYPIYQMGDEYQMKVFGYETYHNYDGAEVVTDTIKLAGQVVTVANEMSNVQQIIAVVTDESNNQQVGQVYDLKMNQLVLDADGCYTFKWHTGAPNVVSPYTRHLGMILERQGRTYGPVNFDAIVVGSLPLGNNFVTNGPDQVLMVLRDPPGAKSRTVWTTGSTKTKVNSVANAGYGDEKFVIEQNLGVAIKFMSGIGLYYQTTDLDNTIDIGGGLHYSFTAGSSTEKTWTVTATEAISTSGESQYVGSKGDVFIGYSTNLLMGQCRKVGFFRENATAPFELKDDVAVSLGDSVTTKFMYSAYEIETVMMPKWEETRNSYLTQHFSTKAEAEAFVNHASEPVYVTWLKEDEENYGQDGTYLMVIPEEWEQKDVFYAEDKVAWCNDQLAHWRQTLLENERDKVVAMQGRGTYWQRNVSFDGGSNYSYSNRCDTTSTVTHTYSHNLGAIIKGGFTSKNSVAGAQFKTQLSIDTENGWQYSEAESDYDENKTNFAEFAYEFSDGNRDTDFSVDVYKSPTGWSDIFSLFGGQSYNPYEPEEKTKYYEPGQHTLSNGTTRMENPDLQISLPGENGAKSVTVTDIPAGGEANVILYCTNLATAHQGKNFGYDLEIMDETNQNGLQILMDGVPINGRSLYLEHGETATKVITIRQTDQSVLDYEGITIWFESQYQPTKIHDEVTLNAHFKPSSSPIDLAIQEPVLNNDREDGILDMKLSDFNRQFKNLKNVGVQYRFQGNTQWTDLFTWWVNPTDTIGRDAVSNALLPESGDLLYAAKMKSNLSFPEGDYQFRAFTTTPYGTENVQVYSDIVTVTKDMTRPRNLYTPAPANGILGYGDQLAIEFNEDIVPGYVGDDNVIVTAKLNNSEVNHDVAYQIIPFFDMPRTVNPVFLKGDFAMDFWLNWHDPGTILHQGAGTDNFALGIDDAGHVKVTIAKAQFVSTDTVPKDEWVFFALSYNAAKMTFDILAQYGTTTVELFHDQPVTAENKQVVNYASDNHLYLGYIWADMHGLSLYNICHDVHEAAATKYQAKDNYIYGLANYWPMDEGHGSVAADTRHTHDFAVYDSWTLNNRNYSLRINKPEGAQADITRVGTGQGDSYAIEMWYNKSGAKDEVVFETATPTVDGDLLASESKLRLRYDSLQSLVLDYGKKSIVVASHEDFPDLRRWHHVALNVVRGQAASFYLDGQRTAVIAERDVPPIEGSRLVIGKASEIQAFADELRIWHAALSESRLLSNIYNTIDTTDVYSRGLVAYYPFEKTGEENGVTTKVATMENMAPNLAAGSAKEMLFDADNLLTHTPPLKNAPDETRLIASPVASERKVVINLTGAGISPRDIEGTTLNVTVDRIHDLHGNTSLPIRWTAYVQQNTLKWMKDSVNIIKKYGDSHTFDVTIENKSGNTEYYTLYNMPQWLTVVGSSASDEVSPLSTKVLRFQVNPLVPVGNYEVTIGVQGNNQIQEPLRVVMKVRGEKPQWTVDPTKYEHQMNYIGQVRIGGILIENSESMVAAFIGDECRGVASPERVRGAAYVTMTVYGNGDTDAGKPISFRIWDASAGIAYTDVRINAFNGSAVETGFQLNAVRGSFDQPVIWTKGTDVEQNLKLTTNWNWVALGVRPADQRPAAVFPLLTPWDVFIKDKTTSMIFCDGNNWMPEDAQIQAATMYKVKITPVVEGQQLPEQVPVTGEQLKLSETPVTLTPGWNWIGYTPLTAMTLDMALAAANPQVGDCVKSQHGIAFYSQNGWEGSLEVMEGGHGYMYNSTADKEKSFVYPDATGTRRAAARRTLLNAESQSESQKTRLFAPTVGNYPDNMSMVIALKDGEQSVDTCEVAAYIGGECRGATRANGGLYYLIIAGEGSGQPLELRTCINGEMVVIDNTQTYISDVNIGTPWNPYVIDLSEMRTGISTIAADDDDDDDWWTLQGFKIGRKPTQSGVYIHHGNKVVIKRVK
ncbi:LamG-like jellyroll fold domain-containing protein [uncultured Prevotella sp.]|uniref:LamG-like jellyroll fold domain-containing protein n=1 Tax=uncultured Prevotella sp. TaxID=159272 RepID=UPI0025FC9B62|nr:LamG-like jellyroll fold domain-containing protein [uncultured Prevotella sp.]